MKRTSTLVLLLIIVGGFSAILTLILGVIAAENGSSNALAQSGNEVFLSTAAVHAIAIFFFSIVSASGELTGEKSRQTMDLLVCSQLTPAELIRGKLFSSLAYSFMITIALLPVYAMITLFCGITVPVVISVFVLIFGFSIVISSVAMAASSLFRKSSAATIISFLIVSVLAFGWLIITAITEGVCEVINNSTWYFGGQQSTYYINTAFIDEMWAFSPVYFIYVIFDICIEGWSNALINITLHRIIITLVCIPAMCALTTFLSLKIARNHVDPLKSGRTKS